MYFEVFRVFAKFCLFVFKKFYAFPLCQTVLLMKIDLQIYEVQQKPKCALDVFHFAEACFEEQNRPKSQNSPAHDKTMRCLLRPALNRIIGCAYSGHYL